MAVVAVHAVVEGPADAPVVLLSHSLGATLETWAPQVPALARAFRVVRYDLRGHGGSPVPPGPYDISDLGGDLVALLDRLQVARAHMVGLSLGAMASLWVAARYPSRVDRLVVCCTSAKLGPPESWSARATAVRAGGTGAVADAVVARWFTPAFASREPTRVAELRAVVAATPAEGYAACCGVIERMDLGPELGAIRAPTLAVAGAEDPATPPAHLARIAAAIPGARLEIVAGAAHMANLEQPDKITELVMGHLR